MKKKKALSLIFGIIPIILGWTLYKQFDFETLKFEHTGLAIIYLITFVVSVFFLIRNFKS